MAGQSMSVVGLQPLGQQPSPSAQAVIGCGTHMALQEAAFPRKTKGVQALVTGQLVGHEPVMAGSQRSAGLSTTPLPHRGRQSGSTLKSAPDGQQPSPGRNDRIGMLVTLTNLPEPPESVPINALMRVKGTRLAGAEGIDGIEFVRTIAAARVMLPRSVVRLSAGREKMSDELQALCFLAGANSIFIGDKLLTTPNPLPSRDEQLIARLGVKPMRSAAPASEA